VSRPPVEVADIIRAQGNRFIENNRSWLRWPHIKVLALSHAAAPRFWRPSRSMFSLWL